MAEKAWIISGSDGALTPGFFVTKRGAWLPPSAATSLLAPVELREDVPRDEETDAAIGDAVYRLFIDGREIPDFQRRFERHGLTGTPISERQYRAMLALEPLPLDEAPAAAPAQGDTMKIVSLVAENVKKLRAVEITPEGNLVQITGRNAQGKSSILDSIYWALAGASHIQSAPIRKGAEKARIKLDLGELIVERRFSPSGSTLTVESAEGARFKSPQTMLDGLLGAISFDPLAFVNEEPTKQFETLRRLVNLDVDFEKLTALNEGDYARRTDINREAKALRAQAEGIVVPPGTPSEKVDTAALLDQIEGAGRANAEIEARKQRREKVALDAKVARDAATAKRTQAAELRRQADQLEADASADDEQADSLDARLANAEPLPEPVDISAVRAALDSAEATNRQVEAAARRDVLLAEAAEKEAAAQALTDLMEAREQEKADAIAKAEMPVPGLGFGAGIVTFNGVPFDQASSAEQIRVSVAIAMAMNPKLRVIRIKEGSLLDEDALKLVAEMARDHDYQVWVERVSSDVKVGILIEDGMVKAVDGKAPPAPKPAKSRQPVEASA